VSARNDFDGKTIHRTRRVVCEACSEFELGKRFCGASASDGERVYVDIDLPDECPVCGAETTEKRGGKT